MPMHDWTKVEADVYHDFHTKWIVACARAINKRLPKGFYAMNERSIGMLVADVLTMRDRDEGQNGAESGPTATLPKRSKFTATDSCPMYPGFRQKRVAIRQELRERIVAIVELVSPGNKHSIRDFKQFRSKVVESLQMGIHAIVIDPLPQTPRDPKGIHASIWKRLTGNPPKTSKSRPLTNVSYEAAFSEDVAYYCYSKPGAVGEPCPELPLFLQPGYAVAIDFEEIYQDAYADVLPRFREQLEG